jgi:hypothetical protein
MGTINEYSAATKLPFDSELYKRVYEFLEDETFSWVTDAWSKVRRADAVGFEPCKRPSIVRRPEWTDEHFAAIVESTNSLSDEHALLHVGDVTCVISREAQGRLQQIIAEAPGDS